MVTTAFRGTPRVFLFLYYIFFEKKEQKPSLPFKVRSNIWANSSTLRTCLTILWVRLKIREPRDRRRWSTCNRRCGSSFAETQVLGGRKSWSSPFTKESHVGNSPIFRTHLGPLRLSGRALAKAGPAHRECQSWRS